MRVLLLRSRGHSEALSFLLEEEGHEPVHLPLLEVAWPDDPRGLRSVAEHVARFRWIIVDGPEAVRAFSEALTMAGTRSAISANWLAPDPATARSVDRHGWVARVVEDQEHGADCDPTNPHHTHSGWGSVAQGLIGGDDEVLVLHEAAGEPWWVEALREGRGRVSCARAWVRRPPLTFEGELPSVVVVESAAEGEALLQHQPAAKSARFIAAGPATAGALQALGVEPRAVASSSSTEALFEATLCALAPL
jgi:uroporphyrinogen-III synthase